MDVFSLQKNRLTALLDLPRGVTAIVGGGGKTTLLLRLAAELSEHARVIVSTTTHIFPPEGVPLLADPSALAVQTALQGAPLTAIGHPNPDGKLSKTPLSAETLAALADYVLLEADGARHLPLKAPGSHEPVIPTCSKLVLAVAGMDGVGQPIRETVFRPELYAALCGRSAGDPVRPADAALVLASADGQRKNVLPGMRYAVVLNKAERPEGLAAARETAAALRPRLQSADSIIIASLKEGLSCLF